MNSKASDCEPDRNTLALDRTVLANERTYQAWIRTGLSFLVSGLAVVKFLEGMMPLWILLILAIFLILFSTAAFIQAGWRYTHIHFRMAHLDIDAMPLWIVKLTSMILAGCSILALAGLLITIF